MVADDSDIIEKDAAYLTVNAIKVESWLEFDIKLTKPIPLNLNENNRTNGGFSPAVLEALSIIFFIRDILPGITYYW